MIAKLDNFLIERVFQPVVDFSQRKPRWWALQMGILMTILSGLSAFLFGWHWTVFAMLLAWPALTVVVCISDETCSNYGAVRGNRWFTLLSFAVLCPLGITVLLVYGHAKPSNFFAGLVMSANVAFNYFAACRPPTPPRRRTSTNLSTSGAA